jgi:lipopolysaccharide/colanic/teichoic acid biosynthesis glycosyltransferase
MDMAYVERRSTWLDLRLLALTAAAVLRGRGAY